MRLQIRKQRDNGQKLIETECALVAEHRSRCKEMQRVEEAKLRITPNIRQKNYFASS
jgi:hypothetical protein